MRNTFLSGALTLAALAAMAFPTSGNAASSCPLDRPIVFAGLDWDSARFHNAVAARLLRDGLGCATDEIPGATIPLTNGLARGDVDVMMEVWRNNLAQSWIAAAARGDVLDIGPNFPDAVQGWYVPAYVVEGPKAPAPDLRHVADLSRYAALFQDREEPHKGRFYNCIAGWACEIVNTRKLEAYGLDRHFTNFLPGTGEALAAAIAAAIKRKQPILFYHWSPTRVTGLYDLVRLDEPPYDEAVFARLKVPDGPLIGATAYPNAIVAIGVNARFADQTPEIVRILTAYETTADLVSEALALMREDGVSADAAAGAFLADHRAKSRDWLPDDAAKRLAATLGE